MERLKQRRKPNPKNKPKQPKKNIFVLCFSYTDPRTEKIRSWDDWYQPTEMGGPYKIEADTVEDARIILLDASREMTRNKQSPFYDCNIMGVHEVKKTHRIMKHFPIKKELANLAWQKELEKQFPNGVPQYRSIDDC